GHLCQGRVRLGDDLGQAAEQLVLRERPSLGKLLRAVPDVHLPADAGDEPLPQVAAQVQHEVRNTVHLRPWPPPHLGIIELSQAVLEPLVAGRQASPRLRYVSLTDAHGRKSSWATSIAYARRRHGAGTGKKAPRLFLPRLSARQRVNS